MVPDKYHKISSGVYRYRVNSKICNFLSEEDLTFLENDCYSNGLKKSRLCLHNNDNSLVQHMLIAHMSTYEVAVHMHPQKCEYISLIKGEIAVDFYDKSLLLMDSLILSESSNLSMCVIPTSQIHSLRILSEIALFAEVSQGPFDNQSTVVLDL